MALVGICRLDERTATQGILAGPQEVLATSLALVKEGSHSSSRASRRVWLLPRLECHFRLSGRSIDCFLSYFYSLIDMSPSPGLDIN